MENVLESSRHRDARKPGFAAGTHSCSSFPRRVRYGGPQRPSVRHKDERRIIMEIVRLCVAGTGLCRMRPCEVTTSFQLIKGQRERKRGVLEQSLTTGNERDTYPLPRCPCASHTCEKRALRVSSFPFARSRGATRRSLMSV